MGSSWVDPYADMYMNLLRGVFFDLDEKKQKEFWMFVGETDKRLLVPLMGKPPHYLVEGAYEGKKKRVRHKKEE